MNSETPMKVVNEERDWAKEEYEFEGLSTRGGCLDFAIILIVVTIVMFVFLY